jgi:tripartite-type tricarboxylate transporter receptor subunit TctC
VLLRMGNPKYDPAKMQWLGGWGDATNTLTLLEGSPAKTLEEAKSKEVILGAIGKTSNTYLIPSLINNQLGTKFKIISGYPGGAPIRLAIEKREVHGWCGQWEGWKMSKPDWVKDGKLVHLLQLANKRAADLPNVPLLSEFAQNDEQRAMFKIVQSGIADRAFAAPPGVPKDRLAAVAKAYEATLRDPAFVADAKKQAFDIDFVSRKDVQEFVEGMMQTPPERVEKMRKAMGLDGQS